MPDGQDCTNLSLIDRMRHIELICSNKLILSKMFLLILVYWSEYFTGFS